MKIRLLLALAVVASACGGAAADTGNGVASLEDPTGTTVAPETEEMSTEEAAIAFTECMRENGVDMEDPTVDADGNLTPGRPSGFGPPGEGDGQADPGLLDSVQSAFEDCGDLLQGAEFGFNQVDRTEQQDRLIELAGCLRDQGLDVADPDLSELGPGSGDDDDGSGPTPGEGGPLGIDFEDPEVQEALEHCDEFIPNVGGGPGGNG